VFSLPGPTRSWRRAGAVEEGQKQTLQTLGHTPVVLARTMADCISDKICHTKNNYLASAMWFKVPREGSGAGVVCPPAAGPQLLSSVGTPYTSIARTPLNTVQTMHNVQSRGPSLAGQTA